MATVIEKRFAEMGADVTMSNVTSHKHRQEKTDLTSY
jgi:hypothetical protein